MIDSVYSTTRDKKPEQSLSPFAILIRKLMSQRSRSGSKWRLIHLAHIDLEID